MENYPKKSHFLKYFFIFAPFFVFDGVLFLNLFFHTPIGTGNPDDKVVNATYIPGANSGVHTTQNLYENVAAGTNHDSEASAAIWNLIYENSDNIAAIFAGHVHGDFYSEILGKTRKIPQILLTGMAYENGHALKITVEY